MYYIILVLSELVFIVEVIIGMIQIRESTRKEITYAAMFQDWF